MCALTVLVAFGSFCFIIKFIHSYRMLFILKILPAPRAKRLCFPWFVRTVFLSVNTQQEYRKSMNFHVIFGRISLGTRNNYASCMFPIAETYISMHYDPSYLAFQGATKDLNIIFGATLRAFQCLHLGYSQCCSRP